MGSSNVAFFGIFDGHGGEYASEFAKDILVQNLCNKIIESKQLIKNHKLMSKDELSCSDKSEEKKVDETINVTVQRRPSGKKSSSKTTDDNGGENAIDSDILDKLKPQKGTFSLFKQTANAGESNSSPPKSFEAKCYIRNENSIDFVKMITDEVLYADHKLVEISRKNLNVAGTTALIAIIDKTKLIVANVGDSRGVLCDHKGRLNFIKNCSFFYFSFLHLRQNNPSFI